MRTETLELVKVKDEVFGVLFRESPFENQIYYVVGGQAQWGWPLTTKEFEEIIAELNGPDNL